jgi:hypothetical protein
MSTVTTSTLWAGGYIPVEYVDAPFLQLEEKEVFVFGSNAKGIHGAGAAGIAFRGDMGAEWSGDAAVQRAMAAPVGHPDRIGRWAVFGVARGFQVGHEGKSYAIQTLEIPGFLRRTSLQEIYQQLSGLCAFAVRHPEWSFIVPPIGEGHAGYTPSETQQVWRKLHARVGIPCNLRFVRLRP